MPTTAPQSAESDGVRPPCHTTAVTEVPSANSGHCSAIPSIVWHYGNLRRPVQTCPALPPPLCSLLRALPLLRNPRSAWAQPSNAVRALTRARPPPAEPSMLCHVNTEDGTLNREHHDAHRNHKDAGAISARSGHCSRQPPRPAPCSPLHHSVLSTVDIRCTPPIREEDDDFRSPRTCTPPLLVSIKGGGGHHLLHDLTRPDAQLIP